MAAHRQFCKGLKRTLPGLFLMVLGVFPSDFRLQTALQDQSSAHGPSFRDDEKLIQSLQTPTPTVAWDQFILRSERRAVSGAHFRATGA
jgi:hypothetical protein